MVFAFTCLGALSALAASFRLLFAGEERASATLVRLLAPTLVHASDEERARDLADTERFALWLVAGALGAVLARQLVSLLLLA